MWCCSGRIPHLRPWRYSCVVLSARSCVRSPGGWCPRGGTSHSSTPGRRRWDTPSTPRALRGRLKKRRSILAARGKEKEKKSRFTREDKKVFWNISKYSLLHSAATEDYFHCRLIHWSYTVWKKGQKTKLQFVFWRTAKIPKVFHF